MIDPRTQVTVDDATFPVVESVFPVEASLEFVEDYFGRLSTLAARGPFVLIADIRPLDTKSAPAAIRNAFFAASDAFDQGPGKGRYLGEAVVVGSMLQRAMFSAYFWFISGAPYPSKVFRTLDDARAWAHQRVREAGAA